MNKRLRYMVHMRVGAEKRLWKPIHSDCVMLSATLWRPTTLVIAHRLIYQQGKVKCGYNYLRNGARVAWVWISGYHMKIANLVAGGVCIQDSGFSSAWTWASAYSTRYDVRGYIPWERVLESSIFWSLLVYTWDYTLWAWSPHESWWKVIWGIS